MAEILPIFKRALDERGPNVSRRARLARRQLAQHPVGSEWDCELAKAF